MNFEEFSSRYQAKLKSASGLEPFQATEVELGRIFLALGVYSEWLNEQQIAELKKLRALKSK